MKEDGEIRLGVCCDSINQKVAALTARSEGTSSSLRLQSAEVDTVIWPVQPCGGETIVCAGKEAGGDHFKSSGPRAANVGE